MYENVHPNLALVLLFVRTEMECKKDLFHLLIRYHNQLGKTKELVSITSCWDSTVF